MIKLFFQDDPLLLVFDEFRSQQEMVGDRLSSNFKLENFCYADQEVFTIGYKDNNPYLFSTIFRRPWWPRGAYRILNRTWKVSRQQHVSKEIDPIFLEMIEAQVAWLNNHKDLNIAFISREHDSRNTLINVKEHLNSRGNNFNLFEDRVWVCDGNPKHCFQDILYTGNPATLLSWKLNG
jgi:hypothetical protein